MDEKQLKTSLWQRVVIILVALLLVGSTVLTYMFIVMSNTSKQQSNQERIEQLEAELTAKNEEIQHRVDALSDLYFKDLQSYRKQVKSYNAASANSAKLQTTDLKSGKGRQLTDGDSDYMAYYIGWCPDGSLLDSSFDYAEDDADKDTPIKLKIPLVQQTNLIEGWQQGVIGMKLGGVRQLSIPGELAYKEDSKCGMSNAPLRYVVMALEPDEELVRLRNEQGEIQLKLYTAMMEQK